MRTTGTVWRTNYSIWSAKPFARSIEVRPGGCVPIQPLLRPISPFDKKTCRTAAREDPKYRGTVNVVLFPTGISIYIPLYQIRQHQGAHYALRSARTSAVLSGPAGCLYRHQLPMVLQPIQSTGLHAPVAPTGGGL